MVIHRRAVVNYFFSRYDKRVLARDPRFKAERSRKALAHAEMWTHRLFSRPAAEADSNNYKKPRKLREAPGRGTEGSTRTRATANSTFSRPARRHPEADLAWHQRALSAAGRRIYRWSMRYPGRSAPAAIDPSRCVSKARGHAAWSRSG